MKHKHKLKILKGLFGILTSKTQHNRKVVRGERRTALKKRPSKTFSRNSEQPIQYEYEYEYEYVICVYIDLCNIFELKLTATYVGLL